MIILDASAGQSTNPGLALGFTYSILTINGVNQSPSSGVTINSETGAITADVSGTYTLIVFATKNPYSTTDIELTVTDEPDPPVPPTPETPPCCATEAGMRRLPYDSREDIVIGKALIVGPRTRPLTFDERAKILKAKSAR
jgi:hypothetical protein